VSAPSQKVRFVFLIIGLIAGWVLGFFLTNIWFLFRLAILGYGDSGPGWINTVDTWIWIISIFVGMIITQWFYHRAHKAGKL